jgi:hypothetical protein
MSDPDRARFQAMTDDELHNIIPVASEQNKRYAESELTKRERQLLKEETEFMKIASSESIKTARSAKNAAWAAALAALITAISSLKTCIGS